MFNRIKAGLAAYRAARLLQRGDLSSVARSSWFKAQFVSVVPEEFSIAWARRLPSVKAAVGELSRRIAAMPVKVCNVLEDGTLEDVSALDRQAVLVTRQWSAFGNRIEGLQRFMRSVLLQGKGAVYVMRDETAQPVALLPLDPDDIHRSRIDNEIVYRYSGPPGGPMPPIVPRDDLVFLPFDPPQDGVTDCSPLLEVWPSVRAALAATMFAAWYFDRGGAPSTVYALDEGAGGALSELKKENAALWRMEDQMRSQQRRSFIVPPGYKPFKLGGNPEEAQLDGQRTFGVQEVARVYGVPPLLLQDLSRSTYANFTQARHSLGETIEQWTERVAMEFSNVLWPAGSRVLKFDTSLAIRDPFPIRMQAYERGIRMGILSQNQARLMEGWQPSDQPGTDDLIRNDIANYLLSDPGDAEGEDGEPASLLAPADAGDE